MQRSQPPQPILLQRSCLPFIALLRALVTTNCTRRPKQRILAAARLGESNHIANAADLLAWFRRQDGHESIEAQRDTAVWWTAAVESAEQVIEAAQLFVGELQDAREDAALEGA